MICLTVLLRLPKRRHAAIARHVPWACVVARQRQPDVPLVHIEQAPQITRSAHDVLLGIERIVYAELARQTRLQLHEPFRAGARDGHVVERRFDLYDRSNQPRIQAVCSCRLDDEIVIGTLRGSGDNGAAGSRVFPSARASPASTAAATWRRSWAPARRSSATPATHSRATDGDAGPVADRGRRANAHAALRCGAPLRHAKPEDVPLPAQGQTQVPCLFLEQ